MSIKLLELNKKDIKDEALSNGVLSELENNFEIKHGDAIFTYKILKTNKLDHDKVNKLEEIKELTITFTENVFNLGLKSKFLNFSEELYSENEFFYKVISNLLNALSKLLKVQIR